MKASEIHNKYTSAFMMGPFRDMLHASADTSEVFTFLESITLGVLLTLEQTHGLTRRETTESLKILQLAVLERLGENPYEG